MTHTIYMTDEKQTDETNETGNENNTNSESGDKPTSLYDKTEAIVTRQEEANKKTEELLTRQETLHANQRLAGTAGGHVEAVKKEETDQEYVDKMRKNGWRADG